MDDSDIRQNPHPKQAYEITIDVEGAPGTFDSVTGSAVFRVTNIECVTQDPMSGVRKAPASFPSTKTTALGNGRYSTTVYTDLLENGDYFGLGICQWKFEGFVASLKANGVNFGADMLSDRILAQDSQTWFVAKELFQRPTIKDLNVSAVPLSDYIRAHPDEFFSITLTAKERHDERLME
jgi:hypothetical protein